MANGFTNFMNGLANGAKSVVMDPIIDLGALAAKGVNAGLDLITGDDIGKTANRRINKGAEEIKNEMKSEVDPTSTAGAIGEGIPVGLANADAVVNLVELAKNVGKQGLKQLPKLLGKYQDAKDKKAQLKAAQEIKDYINKQAKSANVTSEISDVPAYQQKAWANEWNLNNDIKMDKFSDIGGNQSVFPKRNLTDQFRQVDETYTNPVSRDIAKKNIINERGEYPSTLKNGAKKLLTEDEAMYLDVPYRGSNMEEVRSVTDTVNDIAKMSDKDFRSFMQSNESAAMAGYEPSWWDYHLEDMRHSGDLGKAKDTVIKNILHRHSLEQEGSLTNSIQSTIRNNAIKNNKNYRKWIKKDVKNTSSTISDESRQAMQRIMQELKSDAKKKTGAEFARVKQSPKPSDLGFKSKAEADEYIQQISEGLYNGFDDVVKRWNGLDAQGKKLRGGGSFKGYIDNIPGYIEQDKAARAAQEAMMDKFNPNNEWYL